MRLLLDTQIVLWMVADSPRLGAEARERIDAASTLFLSAASIWEMAIKSSAGRLRVDLADLLDEFSHLGVSELRVTWDHARAAAGLPPHHGDPFDRMLVAQASAESLELLTHDRLLARYGRHVTVV